MRKRLVQGLLVGFAVAVAIVALQAAGGLQWLRHPLWDLGVRLLARPAPTTDRIRLIFIDQTSLDWAKGNELSWPWPREIYGEILAFLRRGGALGCVFDLVYFEPCPWAGSDDAFGAALAASRGTVMAANVSREQGLLRALPPDLAVRTPAYEGLPAYLAAHGTNALLTRATLPVAALATNAALVGSIGGRSARDTVVRRVTPFGIFDGRLFPLLGGAAYLAAQPPPAKVTLAAGSVRFGDREVPVDRAGQAWLRYRGPSQTHAAVNAAAVLQSEMRLKEGQPPLVDPAWFSNRYVFVGVTAPGLFDLKAAPVAAVYPGVEVHATFLDNLLAGDFPRPVSGPWLAAQVLCWALLAGGVGRSCRNGWQTAVAFACLPPLPVLAAWGAYAGGWVWDGAGGLLACLGALTATAVLNYAVEGRQKRFIKGAFRQYLSPIVIEQLVRNPGQLKLGGETRELSIFFSDVQGFTSLAESLTPEALTTLLNDYLTAMTDIILAQGGTVDKYEGDAIIAFWNAPLTVTDHAAAAVRSALLCQRKLAELRPAFRARCGRDLHMRIGVNTGRVVVGNMGSTQRFDYTFLGDSGNLAARLEGINKQFGTYLMTSEFTAAQLTGGEFVLRELSRVRVVGKQKPVTVYEPLFAADAAARRTGLDAFDRALRAYYAGDLAAALAGFDTLAEQDPPARQYAARCRRLQEAPPAEWDGVWQMTEK